jgi:hypothetical protein
VTPGEWFDQFPPNPAMDGHTQWCARHWAPCPVLGANGIGAFTEVMTVYIEELMPANLKSADARNRALEKAGLLCCALGDERMYEIWGHWPPAEATTS